MLQTLLQSYQNVPTTTFDCFIRFNSCKRFCKVIKMLAIHKIILIDKYAANTCKVIKTKPSTITYKTIFEGLVANAFAKLSKC